MAWSAFTFSAGSNGFSGSPFGGAAGFSSWALSPWALPGDGGGDASGGAWPARGGLPAFWAR
ncbi:MAG: hypothetical protein MZU95_00925 [Desulfomicrobium escambiense]|nr:hypothetical protein [Desulfomicrobium escambiense]